MQTERVHHHDAALDQMRGTLKADTRLSTELDLEALLRSVQQQEQEELRRMKARAGEAKVGW